jgi:hypothetical protein
MISSRLVSFDTDPSELLDDMARVYADDSSNPPPVTPALKGLLWRSVDVTD